METLHCHNDEALPWTVEPAQSGVAEPVNRALKCHDRVGIIGLDRIINDQNVAAPTSERATDRGCETKSATGGLELAFGGLFGIEAGGGKNSPIKRAIDEGPAVT